MSDDEDEMDYFFPLDEISDTQEMSHTQSIDESINKIMTSLDCTESASGFHKGTRPEFEANPYSTSEEEALRPGPWLAQTGHWSTVSGHSVDRHDKLLIYPRHTEQFYS